MLSLLLGPLASASVSGKIKIERKNIKSPTGVQRRVKLSRGKGTARQRGGCTGAGLGSVGCWGQAGHGAHPINDFFSSPQREIVGITPEKCTKERCRAGERFGEGKQPGAGGRGDATQMPDPNAPGEAILFSGRAGTSAAALKLMMK